MEEKILKGQLFVAMRKDRSKRGFIIRVGYSRRDLDHWLSCYRHEGFRKCHIHSLTVINRTTSHVSLEGARELLLLNIAQKLEQQHVKVFQLGELEYSYRVISKKPIRELLLEYDGKLIIESQQPPEPKEEQTSRCIVM